MINSTPDTIAAIFGNNYLHHWNSDFLNNALGKDGTCARLYYDSDVVLDVGRSSSKSSKRKLKLLTKYGFKYICIPEGCTPEQLKVLVESALE